MTIEKADRGVTRKALLGLLSMGPMSGYDIRAVDSGVDRAFLE